MGIWPIPKGLPPYTCKMTVKTAFGALLLGLVSISQAQVKAEIVGNLIYVEGKINGKSARLVVDSGAGMNVLNPDAAVKFGVEPGQKVNANGAGSSTVQASLSTIKTMEVGSAKVENEGVVILQLPQELECDGLVGFNFLHHFATTIDYQKGTINFQESSAFKPEAGATILPMQITGNIPEIKASVEGFEGWMHVDTGANGSLSLFAPFLDKNNLRERFPKRISTITGAGVGGASMGELARVSTVKIGDITLPPLVVDLSKQTKGAFAADGPIGNIGHDILHRFVFTLDYPGQRFVLKKSPQFNDVSSENRSGIMLRFDGKAQRIIWVLASTPAAEAGVKVGDVIVAVDGQPVDKMRALAVREVFRRPAGTVVKLTIKRGEEAQFEIKLTLRDIVP